MHTDLTTQTDDRYTCEDCGRGLRPAEIAAAISSSDATCCSLCETEEQDR